MPHKVIFMTAPDATTAQRIVQTLVEERIVACGNIMPGITSIYRWEDEVQTSHEVMVLLKTTESRAAQAVQRIAALHPYDVPEAVALDISAGLPAYMDWIHESTTEVDEG
jgi:periplasmic divalent cation tolerance protein